MSRNFVDPWASILDYRGKFLNGRVTFYEAGDTTTKKNVYGIDGTVLANPIYTDAFGKTVNQVLLEDSDYTIVFEAYIGNGTMVSDADNDAAWFQYKTVLSKAGELIEEESKESVPSIETIAALKARSGMKDGDLVEVTGYYSTDDCPTRYFIWVEGSTESADEGIVVSSTTSTTGKWRMIIPGSYVDVRWYGDIPGKSSTSTTSNLGQRALAATAANTYHKDLYFPCYDKSFSNLGYYIFDGTNTVSVQKDIITDNGVRFVVKDGTTGTSVACHEMKKCDKYLFYPESSSTEIGDYSFIADWTNSSWLWSNLATATGARVGYIIDSLNGPLAFSNTKIKIEDVGLNVDGCTFDNCEMVECYKTIDKEVTFKNMEIKTEWFVDDYDWTDLTLIDCTILLKNCKDANTYITLKNKQNETDYGDLGEQEIDATVGFGNVLIENGSGTITLPSSGTTNLELHNFSGTLKGSGNVSVNVNAVDCWLTLDTSVTILDEVQLRRGMLTGSGTLQVIGVFYADNVDISVALSLLGLTTPVIVRNCTIGSTITMITHLKNIFEGNTWDSNSSLTYTSDDSKMVGVFQGNFIRQTSNGWKFASNVEDTSVYCSWVNNHSDMDTQFITFDMTNLQAYDSMHNYTYEGNTGKHTLQRTLKNAYINAKSNAWVDTAAAPTARDTLGEDWDFVLCKSSYLLFSSTNETARQALEGFYVYDAADMIPESFRKVFAIGQRYVKVKLEVGYTLPSIFWNSSGTERNTRHTFEGTVQLLVTDNVVDVSPFNTMTIGSVSFAGHNMVDSSATHGTLTVYPLVTIEVF